MRILDQTMEKHEIQALIQRITKDTASEFSQTLNEIKKSDCADFIEPLVGRFAQEALNSSVYTAIYDTLSQIKLNAALPVFLSWLKKPSARPIHQALLFFIWNSGLNASDHLAEVTTAGLHGDYLTGFEALTVLENQDGPFEEAVVLDALLECKTYLSTTSPDAEKKKIIDAMIVCLNTIEGQIQD